MNNFLISVFCGLIFAVEILAMYLGWLFAKSSRILGWLTGFVLVTAIYEIAVHMACRVTLYLGVANVPLVRSLFAVPIIIASIISIFISYAEKRCRHKIFHLD